MHNSKLIQFLGVLTNKETQKLYDFLYSPFFNKNEEMLALFEYLKPHLKNLDSPELDKKKVFSAVFPEKNYDNIKFNRFCHDAMELCEQFYQHLYLDKHDIVSHRPLFEMYLNQKLPKHYEALHKSLGHTLERNPLRNSSYYYKSWEFDVLEAQLTVSTYFRDKAHRPHHEVKNLDFFYIARKLEYLCAGLTQKNILHEVPPLTLEKEILNYIQESNILEESMLIKMLYHSFLMLKRIDAEVNFHHLFLLLPQYSHQLHIVEVNNFYSFMQNFCIAQINAGEAAKYERLLLDLYKKQIDSKAFFDNKGNILAGNFKNIITLSLRLKEWEWAKDFLTSYAPFLPEEVRNDVEGFCSAKIAFEEGDYSLVIKLLYNIEPADIYYNLNARRLLIQAYYELKEWESALVTLNSLKIFVHRDKTVSEQHKESNRNFINILIKLIRFAQDSPEKIQKLQIEMTNTANIAERKWLTDKMQN